MVISVEFGPGMRFVAPIRSRKCCRSIHFRRWTTSSSNMAMWAAGPPKATVPSFRKSPASSLRRRGLSSMDQTAEMIALKVALGRMARAAMSGSVA